MTVTPPLAESRRRDRILSVVLWLLQILLALGFLGAAIAKFTGNPASLESFDALGTGIWFAIVIGVLEVAGAVALLVPRTAGLAALCFVVLMIGAVLVQVLAVGHGAAMPGVYLVLAAVIAWGRRGSTAALLGRPAPRAGA